MSKTPILKADGVWRSFKSGEAIVDAVRGVSLELYAGESMAIIGSSGSGKTTLLHLLAGLDSPTRGDVAIDGTSILNLTEAKRGDLRNAHLGFIFQFHHLLPELSALENVMMPLLIRKERTSYAKERARYWLDAVGLKERYHHRPAQLSGGERQRAAIARAVVTEPSCLLADEPTGNLDVANAENVFKLLAELNTQQNMAIVVVTHDQQLAKMLGRCMVMSDGEMVGGE